MFEGKELGLIRDVILLPLLILYVSCLVLAAWPTEIRPSFLDGVSKSAFDGLASVGIRAGMPVFTGSQQVLIALTRSECIIVEGTDAQGKKVRLYPKPSEPCPRQGFRWKPEIYDHMMVHWVRKIIWMDNPSNLLAMGDHFCIQPSDHEIREVSIARVVTSLHYETGKKRIATSAIGQVKCRPRDES